MRVAVGIGTIIDFPAARISRSHLFLVTFHRLHPSYPRVGNGYDPEPQPGARDSTHRVDRHLFVAGVRNGLAL